MYSPTGTGDHAVNERYETVMNENTTADNKSVGNDRDAQTVDRPTETAINGHQQGEKVDQTIPKVLSGFLKGMQAGEDQ